MIWADDPGLDNLRSGMRADDLGQSSLGVRRTKPRLCLMRLSADLLRNPVGGDRFVAQLPDQQARALMLPG
jgi:hypothetical protein